MSNPKASNANLDMNPLHLEALSIAKSAGVDFSLNLILDSERRIAAAFAGELESAHLEAVKLVRIHSCRKVEKQSDLVITSSGGYPLDAVFYQCVKGMVSCLPAVKPRGVIIAVGECREGVGSPEYEGLMRENSSDWIKFLSDIRRPGYYKKDQWQLQMQCRVLEKVGRDNIRFFSSGISKETLNCLGINGFSGSSKEIKKQIQDSVQKSIASGLSISIFPEGPYSVPIE